jgi:hypothetical protein
MIDFGVILAVPIGRFEPAKRKSDHMSWDVPHPNVGFAIPRKIMSRITFDPPEIRNTEITNVRTENARLLVNCVTECVPAATCMA